MGHAIYNKADVHLKRECLEEILKLKGWTYKELLERLGYYGIQLQYRGFMSLIQNKVTWKLFYAMALAEVVETTIENLFKIVYYSEEDIKRMQEEYERSKQEYELVKQGKLERKRGRPPKNE